MLLFHINPGVLKLKNSEIDIFKKSTCSELTIEISIHNLCQKNANPNKPIYKKLI